MKKFLLSLSAVLALTATAQTKTDLTVIAPNEYWGSKDVTVSTAGQVDYDSQYGEFNIKKNLSLESYTGMILVYKDAKNTQVKIQGDAADESTYSKKVEVYLAIDGEAGEQTFEFPASLGTTIEALSLQGLEPGATIKFDKIILLKGEEKEVVTEFAGMAWGGTFSKLAADGVDILITDDWGEIGFKEAVSYTEGNAYTYDVTFSEPTAYDLQFKVHTNESVEGAQFNEYDSEYYIYKDIPAGSTSATITIDYEYTGITIPCSKKDNTFYGIKATLTVSDATGIESIANEAATTTMYDLSGRRVVQAEGIVVKNGKIMLVK